MPLHIPSPNPSRKREGNVTLALIDYGAGNLHSVANALKAAGASDVLITADAAAVATADRIVLPGVGAFGACAAALRAVPGTVPRIQPTLPPKCRIWAGTMSSPASHIR